MSEPRELVAVVVPLSTHTDLTPDEEISMRHLLRYLGSYPRYFLAPEELDVSGLLERHPGFRVKRFDARYFGSTEGHRRLVLSRDLYETFADYEYILMYHLDALVFSDQLREWCERGLDYIGAPWLTDMDDPEKGFSQVGNGGFALQKVASHLKVMDSKRYQIEPRDYWERGFAHKPWYLRWRGILGWAWKHFRSFNGVRREMARYRGNSDKFWAKRATHYDPGFRIASIDTGLRFAFECAPRYCFERNGRQLPFGCHAWPVYDREFWEPFVLKEDDVPGDGERDLCVELFLPDEGNPQRGSGARGGEPR